MIASAATTLLTNHILIKLFLDTSEATSSIDGGAKKKKRREEEEEEEGHTISTPLDCLVLPLSWAMLSFGAISGGAGIVLTEWIGMKIDGYFVSHFPWVLYFAILVVVVAGSELPPLTICNGNDSIVFRIATTLLAILFHFFLQSRRSSIIIDCIWIISALWHIYGGNETYHRDLPKAARALQQQLHNPNLAQAADVAQDITRHLYLQYYRVGCGIGMLWYVFGIHSSSAFLWATALMLVFLTASHIHKVYLCEDKYI